MPGAVSITIDDKAFRGALAEFAERVEEGSAPVALDNASLYAFDMMANTPPFTGRAGGGRKRGMPARRTGERAVKKDITRLFRDYAIPRNKNSYHYRAYLLGKTALDKYFRDVKRKNPIKRFNASYHQRSRTKSTGRPRKNARRVVVFGPEADRRDRYIAMRQGHVGTWKAGPGWVLLKLQKEKGNPNRSPTEPWVKNQLSRARRRLVKSYRVTRRGGISISFSFEAHPVAQRMSVRLLKKRESILRKNLEAVMAGNAKLISRKYSIKA